MSEEAPRRRPVPDPPPYVPEPPDPVEAEMLAQLESRGDRKAGEIIEETP